MAVRYSGHWLKTRQQGAWQSAILLAVLVPLVAIRFTTHQLNVALALAGLTMAPFAIAYRASRFLEAQERMHTEPTPEMQFIFQFVANTPMAIGGLLLVLMSAMSR
ncbi:MAG: hypothetical protein RLZZ53_1621 [Acidobacteriota bacterium]|jgi:hypothetical protein